jgi:hypothetical protein
MGLAVLAGIGIVLGAILGAMFPRLFGFVFIFLLGECPHLTENILDFDFRRC